MNRTIILLVSLIFLISCSKSNEEILKKVSSNLNNLKTIKYLSTMEFLENDEVVHKNSDTLSFEFTDGLKYHLSSENFEIVHNGIKTFNSISQEKIITTSDDNKPESVNNPLFLTINPLKQILPKLIQDKSIKVLRKNDTIINNDQHYVFSFLLENRYIDWIASEFKEGTDGNSEYFLIIDKTNYLPYKIISPNGKHGSISRTIENIELDIELNDKLWSGENLPKDYAVFTEKEYYDARKNKVLNNLGKKLTDWELPELNSTMVVNPSKLKGNVILLEFWFKNCGGCIMAIPSLNKIKTRFESDNFKIYGIEFIENYPKENLEKYITDQKILYPTLYKGKTVALNYGIRMGPTFMIIDKSGTIIHIKSGFSEENMGEIIGIIEKNL